MLEVAYVAALAGYLARRPRLRALWRELGVAHRLFLGALFASLAAAQVFDDGRATWPFVPWTMYTESTGGDPVYHEIHARLASGGERRLSAFGAFPAFSTQIHQRMERLAQDLSTAPEGRERDGLARTYDLALRAIADAYSSRSPDDPVAAVEVLRTTIPLAGGTAAIRREPFRRLALR